MLVTANTLLNYLSSYEAKRNEVRTGLALCPQVHQKHILLNLDRDAERCDGQCVLLMGLKRFDGTTSKLADDAVGDDRKSSKTK